MVTWMGKHAEIVLMQKHITDSLTRFIIAAVVWLSTSIGIMAENMENVLLSLSGKLHAPKHTK